MATVTPGSCLTGKALEAAMKQRVLAFACRVLARSGIDASATVPASTHERGVRRAGQHLEAGGADLERAGAAPVPRGTAAGVARPERRHVAEWLRTR